MEKKQMWLPIVVVILVAVGGFFGGSAYQKSKDSLTGVSGAELQTKLSDLGLGGGAPGGGGAGFMSGGAGATGFAGRAGAGGARFNRGGGVVGSIISKDDQSITVKLADGSTKIVYYSGTTTVDAQVVGSASDLIVGKDVVVSGTANSDGSVAATTVSIRTAAPTTTQPATQ